VLGAEPRVHKDGDGERLGNHARVHGDEREPSNTVLKFAQLCIQIVGFRLEIAWVTLQ